MKQNNCLFCDVFSEKSRVIFDSKYFFVILDNFPVNKGHALIIPKRHCVDIFSLNADEWKDLPVMLGSTKAYLDSEYKPDGYNIGINKGEAAGQTVLHLHIHMIPRYKGDVEKPRGGIRNFKKPLAKY